jgi:hypothetical protein
MAECLEPEGDQDLLPAIANLLNYPHEDHTKQSFLYHINRTALSINPAGTLAGSWGV